MKTMKTRYGIDFGTTNSVASYIEGKGADAQALNFLYDDLPHPSVVWYKGTEIIVGKEAKEHADDLKYGGNEDDIIASPKIRLGKDINFFEIPGRKIPASEVSGEIFKHLKEHINTTLRERELNEKTPDRAVVAVPVAMDGRARKELRYAARCANIEIHQFIHEPLAALYAYLRKPRGDINHNIHKRLAEYEDQYCLVCDWGGGTLDVTLVQIKNGMLFLDILNIDISFLRHL